MWDNVEYKIQDLVNIAVDCIDEESENWKISGTRDTQLFPHILHILMKKVDLVPQNYYISEQIFRSELRKFLNEIKQEDDPGYYFVNNLGKLKESLGKKEMKRYTIGFPLNIKFKPSRRRGEFSSLGHKITRMERDYWLSEFKEVAEEKEKEKDRGYEDDPFTNFMEQVPNDFSRRNHTFWKFELEARDEKFVLDRLNKVLEYLLGRINIAAYANKLEGVKMSKSIWPYPWSNLKLPFVYIIFEEDSYSRFYYSEDISPRKKFKVHSAREDLFDIKFEDFPELGFPLTRLEERFVETVRRFQSAISDPTREDSFLEYWRGVEALTLTKEDEGMDTVIKRAEAPINGLDQDLFRYRLNRARKKRNNLVHDGVDVSVTREEQNLLKIILENLIWIYCEHLEEWNEEDFRFFLEKVGNEEGTLENTKQKFKQNIELIDQILEVKRYEETVFEKIFRDWSSNRNELEDADFTDPLGFFYPVFGVGKEDADVMVIADRPTFPVGDDEEIKRRAQVRRWKPITKTWESIDKYREWLENMLESTNPDQVWEILEAVGEAKGIQPREAYYTTLQKDGRFDETLDETKDGKDPIELNEESIIKWTPYLKMEIDHVDPKLIIVFGENTIKSLGNILLPEDEFDSEEIPSGEVYVLDKYPILKFKYWDDISFPDDTSLEEHIIQIVREALEEL